MSQLLSAIALPVHSRASPSVCDISESSHSGAAEDSRLLRSHTASTGETVTDDAMNRTAFVSMVHQTEESAEGNSWYSSWKV